MVAQNALRLLAEPPGYPNGVPAITPHTLREDFPHGVRIGGGSLVGYERQVVAKATLNTWLRRFLVLPYFARYTR